MTSFIVGCPGPARVSDTGWSLVGPTKVRARKSFPFTESSLRLGLVESVTKMVTGCLRTTKVCRICSMRLKGFMKKGDLSIYECPSTCIFFSIILT